MTSPACQRMENTITDIDDGVNMKGEKFHNVGVFEKQ